VPLLCCRQRLEVELEGYGQVAGRLVQREVPERGPEVEHIAVRGTRRVEALEDALAEMDRERAIPGLSGGMKRTGSTTLRTGALELGQTAEMGHHLSHADLPAHGSKVDTTGRPLGVLGCIGTPCGLVGRAVSG